MCGCDVGYTCPRCAPAEDWLRDDELEREQAERARMGLEAAERPSDGPGA